MNFRSFAFGFAVAAIIAIAGGLWLAKKLSDQPIRWMPKTYYDDGDIRTEDTGYVVADGTLMGEDMNGNTFLHIECRNEQKQCRINELSSLGSNRSVFLYNDEWPITSWNKDVIVADSQPVPTACSRVKLVIIRQARVIHYNRIPQATRDTERCKFITNKEFKWTLEDQPLS